MQMGQQIFSESAQFKDILELADGTILAATNQEIFHLQKQKSGEIVLLKDFKYSNEKNLRFKEIFADKEGLIWIGTQDGIRFIQITNNNGKYSYDGTAPMRFASEEIRLSGKKNIYLSVLLNKGSTAYTKQREKLKTIVHSPKTHTALVVM